MVHWPGSRRDGDPFLAKRTAGVPGVCRAEKKKVAGADSVLDSLLTKERVFQFQSLYAREEMTSTRSKL